MKEHKDDFDLIIVDECHKLGANSFNNILMIYGKSKYIFGLSATPDRSDKKHTIYFPYFDNIIKVDIIE